MAGNLRLAVAGVGNNVSALMQGLQFYRERVAQDGDGAALPGIRRWIVGSFGVTDIDVVAAFDVLPEKIGLDVVDAIFCPPNNFPRLGATMSRRGTTVALGHQDGVPENGGVAEVLALSEAEVLLYSLPSGIQWAADAYARSALEAQVGIVNCTPELIARSPQWSAAFRDAHLPLIGDDLASHLGSSVVHRTLLQLLGERGITLTSSYQINLGGNEDFRNLRERGGSKLQSKKNALRQSHVDLEHVEVVPSGGYILHLRDNKVAFVNIEGQGWAGTPVSLDLKLQVVDSSNAAGVIIDLVRLAGAAKREGCGGFIPEAAALLKSPPQVPR